MSYYTSKKAGREITSSRKQSGAVNRYSDWKEESDLSSRENVNYQNILNSQTGSIPASLRESRFISSRPLRQSQMSRATHVSSHSNKFLKEVLLR